MPKPPKFTFGTKGNDVLTGTNKNDFLFGFDGDDDITAAQGNDVAFGGRGNDVIKGGDGNDALFGGRDNDQIFGDKGNDTLHGGRGNDRLDGGDGNDKLFGDEGNDGLAGGAGKDELHGGPGRDFIVGGAGNDDLFGGAEDDTFVFRHGGGTDHIQDLQAGDHIDVRDYGFASGQAVLNAFKQSGHDAVLTLPGGDKVIVENTHVSDLHASQFIVSSEAKGPSSSATPYLVHIDPAVSFESLLTTGDPVGTKSDGVTPWRMVGIPDGLGAFDNGDGTFTVLMNHELLATEGVVRDHGFAGAFVSRLVIDSTTLQVLDASDQIQNVHLQGLPGETANFARFCSADLADMTAFFNPDSGLGYAGGRIFMNGEEVAEGRAFAHIVSGAENGNSYELPRLGNMDFENAVANPHTGDKTVVAVDDDTSPRGQVYFYFGDKQSTGTAVDQAGLTNGNLWGLKIDEFSNEPNTTPLGADESSHFSLVNLGDVSGLSGAQLEAASNAAGVTLLQRPEDGAWDTINPNRYYFVTTANTTVTGTIGDQSRLWAVDFVDAKDPTKGGTVHLLVNGLEGVNTPNGFLTPKMMDNLTVNQDGTLVIQEDVGNNALIGHVWGYNPFTDQLTLLAQHDPARFDPNLNGPGLPGADFITQDEESSGVIDVSRILGSAGQQAYLLDVQAHKPVGGELVEGGQLLLMHYDLL
jgi:RTX calcium-binding nonapeptide repeat (4 copies)